MLQKLEVQIWALDPAYQKVERSREQIQDTS